MIATWYTDLVIYEVYVRAFRDSNADGIGDLNGLADRIGYIRDLGVTAIWLLPVFSSPLRDDGYDISDFKNIHSDLGTLEDFSRLLDKAHAAGIRVITDLVVNHTSDQHPWFQSARQGPSSRHHDYYVWSLTPDRYAGARIIFTDAERSNWTFEPACGLHYWHRFYSHQPDLNYDNPEVRREMVEIVRFWLDLGVDGLRIDAAPYLFEREGTSCENLPETHAFLKEIRRVADSYAPPRLLLAEANQRLADLRPYFGHGDEFQMAFHFPLMTAMFLAIHREDNRPLVDVLLETPTLPEGCQWAMFLRNHDELTLEMLSEEDRLYMFESYAAEKEMRLNLGIRRRLWPLLRGGRRQVELLHGLILSLPGCAVLYYGDEIGMGDDVRLRDRMGVRTPMQWTAGLNAGFSEAAPERLYAPITSDSEHDFAGRNVDAQERMPTSFLNWLRRMVKVHRADPIFRGTRMRLLTADNPKIFAFIRQRDQDAILCLNNLSRVVQPAVIDLSEWRGRIPVDLIGGSSWPSIGRDPYLFTVAPHHFDWFRLEQR